MTPEVKTAITPHVYPTIAALGLALADGGMAAFKGVPGSSKRDAIMFDIAVIVGLVKQMRDFWDEEKVDEKTQAACRAAFWLRMSEAIDADPELIEHIIKNAENG